MFEIAITVKLISIYEELIVYIICFNSQVSIVLAMSSYSYR